MRDLRQRRRRARGIEARGADVVVTDLKMPEIDGIELLRRLRAARPALPVILLTAHGSVPSAVAAMRDGAFDYVAKPFDNDELRALVARALELTRLERENRELRREVAGRYAPDAIVAESARSAELLALVRRVAPSRATVLVQGESGTGKELVARLLHYWSDRVGQPFVAVNCKAFAEGVLESELFGHEKGAFTGAARRRAPAASSAPTAARCSSTRSARSAPTSRPSCCACCRRARCCASAARRRAASTCASSCATNRALRDEVAAGRFREDLFFRLNVIPHAARAAARAARGHAAAGAAVPRAPAARDRPRAALRRRREAALLAHPGPATCASSRTRSNAPSCWRAAKRSRPRTCCWSSSRRPAPAAAGSDGTLQESLDRAAAARIRAALTAAGGNRVEAARALGIERTTLYRMMKRLGIDDV